MRARFVFALVSLFALSTGVAQADGVDAATRNSARKLGAEGLQLYDRGEYGLALEKFRVANQLVPAPTLGVRAARCLEKLGRLVEASEAYLEVTRQELERTAPWVHRKAQAEALAEREKLVPRIPSLVVTLEGPLGEGVAVTVDGDEMPAILIGQKRSIDPGTHTIEATRADKKLTRSITIAEAEAASVAFDLPPLPPPPPKKDPSGERLRLVGWVGVGTGAAGLVVGIANGAAALAQQSSLLDRCGSERVCPPDESSAVSLNDATRVASTVGFIVGAVGLGVGIPLLLLNPKPDDPSDAATVSAWIAPSSAGLSGTF